MTLLLHTSTAIAHLGLADGDQIVVRDSFSISRGFSETLADRIRQFLEAHGSKLAAVAKIVVHAGPGGFTSLRIGVTTANALTYALGIPVIGVGGEVAGLDELLQRSRELPPARGHTVIPVYGREPQIGPR